MSYYSNNESLSNYMNSHRNQRGYPIITARENLPMYKIDSSRYLGRKNIYEIKNSSFFKDNIFYFEENNKRTYHLTYFKYVEEPFGFYLYKNCRYVRGFGIKNLKFIEKSRMPQSPKELDIIVEKDLNQIRFLNDNILENIANSLFAVIIMFLDSQEKYKYVRSNSSFVRSNNVQLYGWSFFDINDTILELINVNLKVSKKDYEKFTLDELYKSLKNNLLIGYLGDINIVVAEELEENYISFENINFNIHIFNSYITDKSDPYFR